MMGSIHNFRNPTHFSLNELRLVGNVSCIREQILNVLDTIIVCMCKEALFQTAVTLTITDDSIHSVMAESVFLLCIFSVKYVVFQCCLLLIIFGMFCFIVGFIIRVFESLTNQSVYYCFLLFCHTVKHFGNGLLIISFLVFICHVITPFSAFTVFICLRIIACMIQREFIFTGVNNRFFIRSVTMRKNGIDKSSWICSSKNQTNFANNTMHDIGPNLFQLISKNRKS